MKPLVSVIVIDYKKKNPYLTECLDAIEKQTYKNFEIILVCDYRVNLSSSRKRTAGTRRGGSIPSLTQKSYGHYVGPAEKRDAGAKMAKGEILAFIDDDAYPRKDWLKNIVLNFYPSLRGGTTKQSIQIKNDRNIAGVGGPGVTPQGVSWQEEASGWASASPVGAGPYTYRFLPGKRQYVDDYPSMNLAVRKADFMKVGGYDSNFWPGEDTKLCLDLTHKLNKKIVYEPRAVVYHHRRPILLPHLKQNGNFGLHRGFFARTLPETSLRLIYFLPSVILIGSIYIVITSLVLEPWQSHSTFLSLRNLGLYTLTVYILVLFLNSFWIFNKSHKVLQSLLSIPVIFITHLWYGTRFLQGFFFTVKLIQ